MQINIKRVFIVVLSIFLILMFLFFYILFVGGTIEAQCLQKANEIVGSNHVRHSYRADIVTGAALGPIFNSCSPTYAFVVATILPASFAKGMLYLIAYAVGVGLTLLAIAYIGQAVGTKLGWLANPNGAFKKIIAILLIIVGLSLIFGLDKKFQTFVLERGWYDPILRLEQSLK